MISRAAGAAGAGTRNSSRPANEARLVAPLLDKSVETQICAGLIL